LAEARPMPEPAPVITATLPTRRSICPSPRYTDLMLLFPVGKRLGEGVMQEIVFVLHPLT
jgi:hypothetical protein